MGVGENVKLVNEEGVVVCRFVDKRDVYTKSDFILQIILLHIRIYRYDVHDTIFIIIM